MGLTHTNGKEIVKEKGRGKRRGKEKEKEKGRGGEQVFVRREVEEMPTGVRQGPGLGGL